MVTAKELIELAQNGIIYVDVGSSVIEAISYDLYNCIMIVSMQRGRDDYTYFNVPFHKFYRFANAESKGWFYNTYVRGRW